VPRVSALHRLRSKVCAAALALGCLALGQSALISAADAAPAGFNSALVSDQFVIGGLNQGVAADWLPDGRMVVLTKPGVLYLVDPVQPAKAQLYAIPDVDARGESGALDVVVDLAFSTNRTVYVYYSAMSDFRLRIARLVLDAGLTTVTSNTTLWSNPGPLRTTYADPTNHIGGSLDIGPDGKFYLSIGDALAALSQDLTNVFGKVLRINLDGSIPADNPAIPGKTIPEIWAYGLRNPYRSQFERGRTVANPLGQPAAPYWIGDVGGNVAETAYEEVNIGEPGRNYGWPLCEGAVGLPKNGVVCPDGITGPTLAYPHTTGVACCFNKAIIGGQMYRSGNFPLSGYYIFGDYPSSTISWMQVDASGRVSNDSGLIKQLKTNGLDEAPVWVDISPNGEIYFLDIFHASLRRLTYPAGANTPPTITQATATPAAGPSPLVVRFAAAATDAQGDQITYSWDFGDGTSATGATPIHTYNALGVSSARVTATAAGQTTQSDPIAIKVGSPPSVSISGLADGALFAAGQTITATASATDAIDGSLAPGQLSWTIEFLHDDHIHPAASGLTGAALSYHLPVDGHDFTGNTRYRITVTATDSLGLVATASVEIHPTKTHAHISANVPTTAVISGITQPLPFVIDTIPNFRHTVEVPDHVCVGGSFWEFARWSDGQARVHTIAVSPDMALEATYGPTTTRCESKFVPVTPKRLFDSRSGTKPADSATVTVPVVGSGLVPRLGVTAVVVNVTAVDAAAPGFVTVWPTSTPVPNSSNLNVRTGETAANLVTVSPGLDGTISIQTTTSAHLLVDVFGYYTSASSSVDGRFVPLSSPQRVEDTRSGTMPGPGAVHEVTILGSAGVPLTGAEAVILNVTAVEGQSPGFVTVWPSGSPQPEVSNLNLDHVGQTRPNQVIVQAGTSGRISLYTSGGAHLLVDVVGYFTSSDSGAAGTSGLFVPTQPGRMLDTRNASPASSTKRTDLSVVGQTAVPGGVLAIVANATVVNAAQAGFVTVFPGGQPVPNTSTLNVEAGQTIANHSTTLVANGGLSLQSTTQADLLLDLQGYYLS
jgi:glucose/arabinose dehydrogenase